MEKDKKRIQRKLEGSFFKKFEDGLFSEIIDSGHYKIFKKDELLIDIGDEVTHIPLIISGIVKIIRIDKNRGEILLYYLEKGDTCAVSFVNCIKESKSIFKGIVEIEAECIMVPIDKIEAWMVKYKSWRQFIIDSYHLRLIEMVETIKSLAFLKLDDRISNYLLNEAQHIKNKKLKITHQQIAQDLNSSRTVVSRLLKKLEKLGKIKLGRNKLELTNL